MEPELPTIPSRLTAGHAEIDETPLSIRTLSGWGLGTLGAATLYQLLSVFLLKYLVDIVGIGAVAAGALIFATKIYDGVIDPLVGIASDRTKSRWGRRRPYILVGGMIFGLSSIATFAVPALHDSVLLLAYLAVVLLVNTTGYALVSIPYLAMPAEMTRDPHQRTRIMSFRVAGLGMAQILGPALGPFLIAWAGGGLRGYAFMGACVGTMVVAASSACFVLTAKAPVLDIEAQPRVSLGARIRTATGNTPFMVLLLVKFSNLIGVNFFFAALPFVFTVVLKRGYGALGSYFLLQAIGIFASQPVWVRLSRRLGKRLSYALAALLYALSTASWVLSGPGDSQAAVLARAIVIGVAGGGLLLAGQSMLPDAIAYDFRRTGLRREGVFAGLYTTAEKVSVAVASLLIGAILGAAGYVGGKHGDHVQTVHVVQTVGLMMLTPALFQGLSALALIFLSSAARRLSASLRGAGAAYCYKRSHRGPK